MIINMNGVDSGGSSPIPSYAGPYTVNSKLDVNQSLNTAGKYMESNLIINSINITRTQNEYGGITVTIEEAS